MDAWSGFVIHKKSNVVFASKPFNDFVFVFIDASHEIIGHACVKRARLVGDDVNVVFFAHCITLSCHSPEGHRDDVSEYLSSEGSHTQW